MNKDCEVRVGVIRIEFGRAQNPNPKTLNPNIRVDLGFCIMWNLCVIVAVWSFLLFGPLKSRQAGR